MQGVGFFAQQGAGAQQLGIQLAPLFLGAARHLQLPHGVEQRLHERHVLGRVAVVAVGQHHHGHHVLGGMDRQAQAGSQCRQARGHGLAAWVGGRVAGDQGLLAGQHGTDDGVGLVKHQGVLRTPHGLHARGLVPADVRHRMHMQGRGAVGLALHVAHHAKAAARQLHQLFEQGVERCLRAGAGNEHRLRP